MNHYDVALNDLIEHIKADKGIVQPWRNDAIAQLRRATAFIRMGLTTTYQQPSEPICICPEGGLRRDCPVHGKSGNA